MLLLDCLGHITISDPNNCGTDIFEDKTALSYSVPGLWEEVGGPESLGMRLKVATAWE